MARHDYHAAKGTSLIPGTEVRAVMRGPLNDPTAYDVRGSILALRSEDASKIVVRTLSFDSNEGSARADNRLGYAVWSFRAHDGRNYSIGIHTLSALKPTSCRSHIRSG